MESADVENLALLLWRKRRCFRAENALISEKIAFANFDSKVKRNAEAWKCSRAAITSGGLLKYSDNPLVIREAKELLEMFREIVNTTGFSEDSRLLKKLYGQDQDEGRPYGLRLLYEVYATSARLAEKTGDISGNTKLKEIVVALIDAETERLTELEKVLVTGDMQRVEYKLSAAVIPGQEVMELLMRYETHFSREIDKILNQLERLQRMRKGQPLPPQLEVKIS